MNRRNKEYFHVCNKNKNCENHNPEVGCANCLEIIQHFP